MTTCILRSPTRGASSTPSVPMVGPGSFWLSGKFPGYQMVTHYSSMSACGKLRWRLTCCGSMGAEAHGPSFRRQRTPSARHLIFKILRQILFKMTDLENLNGLVVHDRWGAERSWLSVGSQLFRQGLDPGTPPFQNARDGPNGMQASFRYIRHVTLYAPHRTVLRPGQNSSVGVRSASQPWREG
jgi:hypothetical protein